MTRIAEQKLKSTAETKSNVNIILKSKRFNQVLSNVVLRYRKFSYLKDKLFLRLNVLNITQQTFQRRFDVAFRLIWRRDVAQRQINVEIYNVEQRWNNVVYFNFELNNVRPLWNNVVIFNVDFDNVGKRRNNVANRTIWKKTLSLDSKAK